MEDKSVLAVRNVRSPYTTSLSPAIRFFELGLRNLARNVNKY